MSLVEFMKNAARPIAYRAIAMAGRSYIAGESLEQALETSRHLCERGYSFTLGYWNSQGESPAQISEANSCVLEAIDQFPGSGYLSLKVPPLQFDHSLYDKILVKARQVGVPITLDSHSHEDAAKTMSLIADRTPPPLDDIGCVLPGRWKRSVADADLAAELRFCPRVVKGQWPDPDDPERDPRSGFLAVVKRLAGRVKSVRIASHDAPLVSECCRILHRAHTACELELLYGLPVRAALAVARENRIPVRIYVPFGQGSLPYAVEYLRKRPRAVWWLLKDSVRGQYRKTFPRLSSDMLTYPGLIAASGGKQPFG